MMHPSPQTNLLRSAFTLVVGAVMLVLGFMFSVVLIAVVAIVVLIAGAYFFWKTRHLRKAMREMRSQAPNGQVIDGEAIVVEDYRVTEQNNLSDEPPDR